MSGSAVNFNGICAGASKDMKLCPLIYGYDVVTGFTVNVDTLSAIYGNRVFAAFSGTPVSVRIIFGRIAVNIHISTLFYSNFILAGSRINFVVSPLGYCNCIVSGIGEHFHIFFGRNRQIVFTFGSILIRIGFFLSSFFVRHKSYPPF